MMNNSIFSAIVVELNNLNDVQGAQILSIIKGFQSTPEAPVAPAPKPQPQLSIPEEKTEKPPMKGTEVWGSDNSWVSVRKFSQDELKYIVYINVPALVRKKDDNGDTKKAKNRAQYIREQIKKDAKQCGAIWAGNFDAGQIYWGFKTKTAADKFIASQKSEKTA